MQTKKSFYELQRDSFCHTFQAGPGPQVVKDPSLHLLTPDGFPKP